MAWEVESRRSLPNIEWTNIPRERYTSLISGAAILPPSGRLTRLSGPHIPRFRPGKEPAYFAKKVCTRNQNPACYVNVYNSEGSLKCAFPLSSDQDLPVVTGFTSKKAGKAETTASFG